MEINDKENKIKTEIDCNKNYIVFSSLRAGLGRRSDQVMRHARAPEWVHGTVDNNMKMYMYLSKVLVFFFQ